MPPIRLGKGPVAIFPPNKKVKNFFNNLGTTIEINNEKFYLFMEKKIINLYKNV